MAIFQVEYQTHGKTCFLAHFHTLQSAMDRYRDKEHAAVYILAVRLVGSSCMTRELIDAKGIFSIAVSGETI